MGKLHTYDGTNWVEIGVDGTDGSTWYSGSGAPSGGTGVNGDFYWRTDTYQVYEKSGGSWSVITTIPTGIDVSALTAKATPVDADLALLSDSAASFANKKLTFANLWNWVLSKTNWVTTAMLQNNSVTTAKIGDNQVTASKIDFTTLNFGNYSTTEQDTGFKWIDGKTVYKKTVNINGLPNNSNKSVAHGITGLASVLGVEGWATDGTTYIDTRSFPLSTGPVATTVDATNIYTITTSNRSSYSTAYATIYYTKT